MTQSDPSQVRAAATPIRVNYRMTDQMGVVYYANYLEFFEIARGGLLRAQGLEYRQMEADGFLLPVVHAACDYLAPARYEDLLQVRTWITRLTRLRIHFAYEITIEGRDGVIARGQTQHIVIGPDGRPRRLNPEWHERLKALDGAQPSQSQHGA